MDGSIRPNRNGILIFLYIKRFCPAPIISLRRRPGYDDGCGADYYSDSEPDALLQLVDRIVGGMAVRK
jgi:hypothetical protein